VITELHITPLLNENCELCFLAVPERRNVWAEGAGQGSMLKQFVRDDEDKSRSTG
jgi:hypothetical protein